MLALAAVAFGRRPIAFAATGLLAVPTVVVTIDRFKWRTTWTSYSWTDDREELTAIADQLVALGLEVYADVVAGEDESGTEHVKHSLRYRNMDASRVHRELTRLGIPASSLR